MATRRPSKPREQSKHKVEQHLDEIKKDVMALKAKIGKTKQSDLTKLSADVAKKVSDSASEIIKSSTDVLHKATKVLQGAVEGGRRCRGRQESPETR